jgi:NAD(P)-dependent dehydrogenase (short-subunit alcohol dehydrogenase family)
MTMTHQTLKFAGQVALVTGAGRGLGRAIALNLAARGASVVINDFGVDLQGCEGGKAGPAQSVVEEIRAMGGTAEMAVVDIGSADGVRESLRIALEKLGGLHIVVHNASPVMPMTSLEDASQHGFEVTLRVNAVAAWELARQSWLHFKRQRYGRIVLISSAAGLWGRSGMPAYSLAKSSMPGFAKYLAGEGEAFGIRANCLAPVAHTRAWEGQNVPSELAALMPAEQVAEVVALLAHEQCPANGELFHSAGSHLSRVFVAQSKGVSFDPAIFSAECVLNDFPAIMGTDAFEIPSDANHSGALMRGHGHAPRDATTNQRDADRHRLNVLPAPPGTVA